MSRAEPLARRPEFRLPVAIPTNWCVTCELTLRTEAEYKSHIAILPSHYVKPITKLVCPLCGSEVELENGILAEHWLGYYPTKRKCSGSGRPA